MGYLQFDKNQLVNLEYSLSREILRSNRSGSYASTTIVGCNTRKYHGLLICPCHKKDNDKFVLLSSLDATIIQHNQEFNMGIHKYQGDLYIPRGHKYIRDFQAETTGLTTFRIGGVVLEKESLLVQSEAKMLIKYTLVEAHSPTTLRLKPFLAFRSIHSLSKANLYVNSKYRKALNGVMMRLYEGFPGLYMQFSKEVEYVHAPDWYYNIEYTEEQKRGYDYKEDLFVPGYFDCQIRKGESIIFSASTSEVKPASLKRKYTSEKAIRLPRDSFMNCLLNAAGQFIERTDEGTGIIAGFPWFGTWGRDTFISLPGLTLSTGEIKTAGEIFDSMVRKMRGGLFPNNGDGEKAVFNSVDAPLWFIWSLQQYEKYNGAPDIWKVYGKYVKAVMEAYRQGTDFTIKMLDNGLIYSGEPGKALTWMDAITPTGPATPRTGLAVEVNALWYNAVRKSMDWAEKAGDTAFVSTWRDLPALVEGSFLETFWDKDRGYLADVVFNGEVADAVRPNQVIAAAMPFTPLTLEMKNSILEIVKSELLTPKGLRTLSPKNPEYRGVYAGSQEERDKAYHQGTVWPWLLEHFVKAYLDVHKNSGLSLARQIFNGFHDDMTVHGIGSISEIYDGDPPHAPRGAISQAWSIAALLRINEMIARQEMVNANSNKAVI
ncbi:MAG TPA: amylo-alpha-1,6-glucosidase [Bacteroidales bacterium]|nr:amylo-alpha-1,6-glucosidase [Bacteroidales bacterium]